MSNSTPKIQAVRGMNDILPPQTTLWQHIEAQLREIFNQYHYEEIRLPILEKTALFQRGIGEVTDIVEKEMYTFCDRNGESLTLRPEGTAGCVRAVIEHGLLHHQPQKLWYAGPMFRYERPQKGRYRQFYQVDVETFGFSGYLIEAELILMMARFFEKMGIKEKVALQLNSLGNTAAREKYREKFVDYCRLHVDKLDEEAQRRLAANPLRILDSKDPDIQDLLQDAPELKDFLDDSSRKDFQHLCALLDEMNVAYTLNTHLVRGLDYYTGTVFEWVTPFLGAQGAVCAGGRFDGLVEALGGQSAPAAGFALGMERVAALCGEITSNSFSGIYIIFTDKTEKHAVKTAEKLRDIFPHIPVEMSFAGGSFKSQFKRADKSQARVALILGEDEVSKNVITCKNLREAFPQVSLTLDNMINHLRNVL
jgi:histidyl-tRNA synthetase